MTNWRDTVKVKTEPKPFVTLISNDDPLAGKLTAYFEREGCVVNDYRNPLDAMGEIRTHSRRQTPFPACVVASYPLSPHHTEDIFRDLKLRGIPLICIYTGSEPQLKKDASPTLMLDRETMISTINPTQQHTPQAQLLHDYVEEYKETWRQTTSPKLLKL
ncbi:MAG: hypothetical protein CMM93_05540 [Rickettsiales bacterium]|nr:hypothetical protein [Rickettsiales bacterium]|tara:strand:+ start:513 stop:992 length:480 start_codon:yes stop_codon:yes gene_type:complete